jgi:CRISPR-associated protein Cas1
MTNSRIYAKLTKDSIPQISTKFPFLYLERGKIHVDDSSIKFISEACVVRIPVATVQCLFLGPGTSITHEAIKVIAMSGCNISWVGEDGLSFHAFGVSPTATTKSIVKQIELKASEDSALRVARKMFEYRFPGLDIQDKTLNELMGMEGYRVREEYQKLAYEHKVRWDGRDIKDGKISESTPINRAMTITNSLMYGLVSSVIHGLGYSLHIGFIHSGSPLPFVYDVADLYKRQFCIELSFRVTGKLNGQFDHDYLINEFKNEIVDKSLMTVIIKDLARIMK